GAAPGGTGLQVAVPAPVVAIVLMRAPLVVAFAPMSEVIAVPPAIVVVAIAEDEAFVDVDVGSVVVIEVAIAARRRRKVVIVVPATRVTVVIVVAEHAVKAGHADPNGKADLGAGRRRNADRRAAHHQRTQNKFGKRLQS